METLDASDALYISACSRTGLDQSTAMMLLNDRKRRHARNANRLLATISSKQWRQNMCERANDPRLFALPQ